MSRFVRPSKYRHTFGQKSKVSYENAKISGSAWDTDLVTAGGKYIAVNWQVSGGGAFAVLPSFSPFTPPLMSPKLPDILPLARGHTAPVLDTAWSPFDDGLVVSAGEDGKIFIWNIEDSLFEGWGEEGWQPTDLSPAGRLNAGGRKVGQVIFNPAASSLLTSASGDHLVRLWDMSQSSESPTLTLTGHKDTIQSIAWNAVGTTLATTSRDRKIRLFDPRAGTEAVRVADGHGGVKGSRVVWLGDRDRIATTGFSKMSDRQLSLWETGGLTNLGTNSLDSSAGVLMPFFAEGNDVLFLAGKGRVKLIIRVKKPAERSDGNIRFFEFEADQFHFLNEHKTSEPQRGMGFIPRRALDVSENEIARAFKLAGNGIEPLSFIVPRKAEGFQADIFPPANSDEPALTAAEWFAGKTARPKLIDLETRAVSSNATPISAPPTAKPEVAAQQSPPAARQLSAEAPVPQPPPAPTMETPKIETPKAETPKAETPRAATSVETPARSLDIEQLESDDEAAASAPGPAPKYASSGAANTATSVTAPSDHLLVKLLSASGRLPTRGSSLAAGYDLYSAEEKIIPARGKALIDLQLSVAIPVGTYGRIAPRSGLAAKHAIDTGAGVIDADYRGPVMVLLFNHSDTDFTVHASDRVAQLILEEIRMAPILQVDDLEATTRGADGFGSTGGFGRVSRVV